MRWILRNPLLPEKPDAQGVTALPAAAATVTPDLEKTAPRAGAAENLLTRAVSEWLPSALRWAVAGAAILFIGVYLFVAYRRMVYPFDLERLEGSAVGQVDRVLHGQPLFMAPSLNYVPMVYTPVYFYVSALAAKLMGLGFAPLRLVSILSSLGCFALLYRFVHKETSSHYCSLVSVGLFAATFRETGDWLELARTDSLYLFLLVLGAYLLRWKRHAGWLAIAGGCTALAFLTKQTALIVILPMVIYAGSLGFRFFAAFAGTAGLLGAGGSALLHLRSGGWSTFYLFSLTSSFLTMKGHIILFWINDIFRVLPIAVAFCVFFFLDAAHGKDCRGVWFYFCFGAGMLAASWLYSLNWGAYLNGRLPVYLFLCLATGLAAHRLLELLAAQAGDRARLGQSVLFTALLIQSCALVYDPRLVTPGRRDIELGREVLAKIAQFPGPVYVPNHNYLAAMAGKQGFADILNLCTLLVSGDPRTVAPLRDELREAFRQKRFSAVVQDAVWTGDVVAEVYRSDFLENYRPDQEIVYPSSDTRHLATGLPAPPRVAFIIYVPKTAENASPIAVPVGRTDGAGQPKGHE